MPRRRRCAVPYAAEPRHRHRLLLHALDAGVRPLPPVVDRAARAAAATVAATVAPAPPRACAHAGLALTGRRPPAAAAVPHDRVVLARLALRQRGKLLPTAKGICRRRRPVNPALHSICAPNADYTHARARTQTLTRAHTHTRTCVHTRTHTSSSRRARLPPPVQFVFSILVVCYRDSLSEVRWGSRPHARLRARVA